MYSVFSSASILVKNNGLQQHLTMAASIIVHSFSSIPFRLLGQLLSFTDQLFQGQSCANLKWSSPPAVDSIIPKSHSLVSLTSQTQGQVGQGGQAAEPPEQQSKSGL